MDEPRAVVAAPIYNQEALVESALASLRAQTFPNFALLLLDDCSTDRTGEIARRQAEQDPRVSYSRNPRRLGMLDNTRRALTLARALFPGAEFIALGSDHDWWHPEWLASLVAAMDASPGVVLAYPLVERISLDGEVTRRPWRFDTAAIESPRKRLRATFKGSAGEMIYGLFRAPVLDRSGHYRSVLVPDRLLLAEVALLGRFRQVDRVLMRRRLAGKGDLDRQRRVFFLGEIPWHAKLPWLATHAAVLALEYPVRGKGRPELGRISAAPVPVDYVGTALWRRFRNRLVAALRSLARRPAIRRRLLRMGTPSSPNARWAYVRLLGQEGEVPDA